MQYVGWLQNVSKKGPAQPISSVTESVESCDLPCRSGLSMPLSEHYAAPALVGRSAGLLDQYAILGMHTPKWSVLIRVT